jgi:hypothetical protein
MPKKKSNSDKQKIKQRSLFDHLNQITFDKNPNYWDSLSEGEKKSFSVYMIHRFLSMEMDYVDIVSEVQSYQLTPEMTEKFFRDFLPKKKLWNKYLKGVTENDTEAIDIIAEYNQVSKREAIMYYHLLKSRGEIDTVDDIKKLYGQRFEQS